MKARNKTKKLALVRLLHRSGVEFGITFTSWGSVTVTFPGVVHTYIFGSLDPSMSGGGVTYFMDWGEFEQAIAAEISLSTDILT